MKLIPRIILRQLNIYNQQPYSRVRKEGFVQGGRLFREECYYLQCDNYQLEDYYHYHKWPGLPQWALLHN